MTKFALLVGISKYLDVTYFPPISFCYQDVIEIYRRVINPKLMGYQPIDVRMLHHLTREEQYKPIENNVFALLDDIIEDTTPGDTFLFYFSGHGCVKEGEAYLVAMDSRWNYLGTEGKGIKLSEIRDRLQQCKANQKIAIIDACHSGENLSKAAVLQDKQFHTALEELKEAKGVIVLSSCEKGQKSWGLKGKNQSVFTKYLLEGLDGKARNGWGDVTVFSLAEYTARKVADWGKRQDPRLKQKPTLYAQSHASGFVLVPSSKKAKQPPRHKKKRQKKGKKTLTSVTPDRSSRTEGVWAYPSKPNQSMGFSIQTRTFMMRRESVEGGIMMIPELPVQVYDRQGKKCLNALGQIDTTSFLNLISTTLLMPLGYDIKALEKMQLLPVYTATPIYAYKAFVRIDIGGVKYKNLFYAVDNIQNIMLGVPFLNWFNVELNYKKGQFTLNAPNGNRY